MVEASTELLGGAAVTVFLALLFFGVVVLWDVALALRSVGDKIDKLEDNIDDDLTDIAHSLDGISNAPGGGGGTQLHLSGGTISSGPGANQQPQQQPQQAPHAGQQGAGPQQAAGSQQAAAGQTEQPGGVGPQPQHHQSRAARRDPAAREGPTAGEDLEDHESPDSDRTTQESAATADEPSQPDDGETGESDDERSDEESDRDGEADTDGESPHPRAEINRGRFVTSPDRTAWYATPLDREAIEAARPTIAGALPDGSDSGIDEDEIIAAGPVDSSEAAATDDGVGDAGAATAMPASDGDAAGESADDTDADAAEEGDDGATTDEAAVDEEASDAIAESAEAADAAADGHESTDEVSDAEADEDGAEAGTDEDGAETSDDEAKPEDATPADEIPESPDEVDVLSFDEGADEDGADRSASDSEDRRDHDGESDTEAQTDRAGVVPVEEDEPGDADGDDRTDVPDLPDGATESEMSPPDDESESGTAGDSAGGTAPESETDADADDAGDDRPADALAGFEFDDEFETDGEDDVTVEEAVDTMNEDAPAPELSSHRFDVTAEDRDDGSAVLTFEFDTETVDITGSTERLLQYQMRSFADRESTPDGDVTIGRDRIVIAIPDSDGTAIQQWGEAAVSIIDRTLYLSDNSDGS